MSSELKNQNQNQEDEEKWNNDIPFVEQPWKLIQSYYKNRHLEQLVRHQIESYNHFMNYQIFRTIEMFNPLIIRPSDDNEYYSSVSGKWGLEIELKFSNFCIIRPQINENNGAVKIMFPQEARLRDFSYSSQSMIDVNVTYTVRNGPDMQNENKIHRSFPKIQLGKIPIMLRSSACMLTQYDYIDTPHTGECTHDPGGYFIINGSEKTILGQERPAENTVYCFNILKSAPKFSWSAEVKSVPTDTCISPKQISVLLSSKNNGFGFPIQVQLARLKSTVPLFIMFRALGVLSDKNICELIILDIEQDERKEMLDVLQASIIEANNTLKAWVQTSVRNKYRGKIDTAERRLSNAIDAAAENCNDGDGNNSEVSSDEEESEDDGEEEGEGEEESEDEIGGEESEGDGSDNENENENNKKEEDVTREEDITVTKEEDITKEEEEEIEIDDSKIQLKKINEEMFR